MSITQAIYAILGGGGFGILGAALLFRFTGKGGGGGRGGLEVPTPPPTDDTGINPPSGNEDEELARQRQAIEGALRQGQRVPELA